MYNIWFTSFEGPIEKPVGEALTYTWTVSDMFYDAFRETSNKGFRCLNGMKGSEALGALDKALMRFVTRAKEYREMQPKSGFGSYEDALIVLRKMRDFLRTNPNVIVSVE
jgi:hypothetical protein